MGGCHSVKSVKVLPNIRFGAVALRYESV